MVGISRTSARVLRRRTLIGAFAALLAMTGGARGAEMPFEVPADDGQPVHYRVGAWSEYLVHRGKESLRMRAALVARTDDQRETFELALSDPVHREQAGVTVRLVFANPIGYPRRMVEVAAMLGNVGPVLIASSDGPDQRGGGSGDDLGRAEVTVRAGHFTVDRRRATDDSGSYELWVNHDVGPLGLVRLTGPGARPGRAPAVLVELVARGSDARPTVLGAAQPGNDVAMTMMWRSLAATGGHCRARPPRRR